MFRIGCPPHSGQSSAYIDADHATARESPRALSVERESVIPDARFVTPGNEVILDGLRILCFISMVKGLLY